MASVFIEDLKVDTVVGVCEWEKQVQQTLHFDIRMAVDISAVADSDNLDKTVNYAIVAEQVAAFVQSRDWLLIETLVQQLLQHLLAQHNMIDELTITLRKPMAIESANCAGITASLRRD